VLVDLLGLDKLSNAFGLVLLFQGIGAVAGPPFAGLYFYQVFLMRKLAAGNGLRIIIHVINILGQDQTRGTGIRGLMRGMANLPKVTRSY